nr:unnamed protein product [Callosobruchus chinensis]
MDQESSIRLIELYQTYRFLWDAKDKLHHNKTRREDAWKENSEKIQYPVPVLKAKMKTLMGSYRSEKSRENKSKVTGSGSQDVYYSKWFAYKYFNFLADKDHMLRSESSNTSNDCIRETSLWNQILLLNPHSVNLSLTVIASLILVSIFPIFRSTSDISSSKSSVVIRVKFLKVSSQGSIVISLSSLFPY